MLDKNAILSANDVVKELVHVPEWGGDIYVKGMTGAERDGFEASIIQMRGRDANVNFKNIRAKLAVLTICDADGKRLFTDKDLDALANKSAVALQRIFPVAQRLSGIGDNDVKELAEGLQENPTADSVSDLP